MRRTCYLRGRKATPLGMLVDERLAIRQIDAKSFVTSHVGMFPLNVFPLCFHLGENSVRIFALRRGVPRAPQCRWL